MNFILKMYYPALGAIEGAAFAVIIYLAICFIPLQFAPIELLFILMRALSFLGFIIGCILSFLEQ